MSFDALSWAMHQSCPDSETKLLLIILADRANDDKDEGEFTCWPSIERLAKDCVMSENTVRDRLKWLIQQDLVTRIERKDSGGRDTSSMFILHVHPILKGGVHRVNPEGAPGGRGEGSRREPKPVSTEPVRRTLKESKGSDPEIPDSLNNPEFLRVWECWKEDRKARKKPITFRAAQLQLAACEKWGLPKAIESIKRSISCGYQGLFEIVTPLPRFNQNPQFPQQTQLTMEERESQALIKSIQNLDHREKQKRDLIERSIAEQNKRERAHEAHC